MNTKIIYKLSRIISKFKGLILKDYLFHEKKIGDKNCLVLELKFLSEIDGEIYSMILTLDKDITFSESEKLYQDLVK